MKIIKKITPIMIIVVLAMCFSACTDAETAKHLIKIGVMGDPNEFYASYRDGIAAALSDVRAEYADTGYMFELEYFNDESNYETGMKIVDILANDNSIVGVIGSKNLDITGSAAHIFDEHKKIFVSPHYMYDSVCDENYYDYVFAMCSSARNTGILLRKAAVQSGAKKWAVCSAAREIERDELHGFINYTTDDVEIIDCVSMDAFSKDFDKVCKRWDILGVEGVAFFVNDDEGIELLKKLKAKEPELICAGDILFDDSERMDSDADFNAAMKNFIMADAFYLDRSDELENEKFTEIADDYFNRSGVKIDYWYLQGYNSVRMICDTAIKNKTNDPTHIAEALHNGGYDGLMQKFEFDGQGVQNIIPDYYNVYTASGLWEEHSVR